MTTEAIDQVEVVEMAPGSIRTVRVRNQYALPTRRRDEQVLTAIRGDHGDSWAVLLPPKDEGSSTDYGWRLDWELYRWPALRPIFDGRNLRAHWLRSDEVDVLTDVWSMPVESVDDRLAEAASKLEEMTMDRDTTQSKLAELQTELVTVRTGAQGRVDAVVASHERDIAIIGAALLEEAQEREWCGDYDRVIDQINSRLSVPLPIRTKDFRVYLDLTVRVTVDVEARDAEDAENLARERDFQSLIYGLNRSDIDVTDSEVVDTETV